MWGARVYRLGKTRRRGFHLQPQGSLHPYGVHIFQHSCPSLIFRVLALRVSFNLPLDPWQKEGMGIGKFPTPPAEISLNSRRSMMLPRDRCDRSPSILGSQGCRLFTGHLALSTNKPAMTGHRLLTEAKSQWWDLPQSRSPGVNLFSMPGPQLLHSFR